MILWLIWTLQEQQDDPTVVTDNYSHSEKESEFAAVRWGFVLLKQSCINMLLQLCPKHKVTMKISAHLVVDVARRT